MTEIKTIGGFTEYVKNSLVSTFLDCRIENTAITKNNGVRLAGITIRQQDSNVSPAIYLEKYFADFQCGNRRQTFWDRRDFV